MKKSWRRGCLIAGVAATGAIAFGGCDPNGEPTASGAELCSEREDVEVHGCALVEGVVVTSSGSPLSGITVGPRYPDEPGCCTTTYATTDAAGSYSLRIERVVPARDPANPDSMSLFILAQQEGVGALDSAFARIRLSGTGEYPFVNEVDVTVEQ